MPRSLQHDVRRFKGSVDNTLSVSLRQMLVPVLDNRPVEDKLKQANHFVGSKIESKRKLLGELLAREDAADETGLKVAAMYYVYAEGMTDLYSAIAAAREATEDSFVAETAEWVAERVA